RMKEPLERIQGELLDRGDRHRAGVFAGRVSAHAVGDEKDVCTLVAKLHFRLRQARIPNPHRLREIGDEKLVLVRLPDPPDVTETEGLDFERLARRVGHSFADRHHPSILRPIARRASWFPERIPFSSAESTQRRPRTPRPDWYVFPWCPSCPWCLTALRPRHY